MNEKTLEFAANILIMACVNKLVTSGTIEDLDLADAVRAAAVDAKFADTGPLTLEQARDVAHAIITDGPG